MLIYAKNYLMSYSMTEMLGQAETIAILGCSAKQYRTSHQIAAYLQNQGYRIVPINPQYDEILGEKVYPTMRDLPDDITIDIADIFRNSDYTAEMVAQIIEYAEATGDSPAVWTQLDVSSPKAQELAEQAGLTYVKNHCIMVEHKNMREG